MRVRSAPAYVSLGDEVVSLVVEGEMAGSPGGGEARPVAVYLIDSNGVRKFTAQPGSRSTVIVALVGLGACLLYALQRMRGGAAKRS